MVSGRHKSRSMRRVRITTPGNRRVTHYKKRKPRGARCAECGAMLKGTPRERPYKMRKLAKTKKRPERPYGGILCSRCTRKRIISHNR